MHDTILTFSPYYLSIYQLSYHLLIYRFSLTDINECAASQCDVASTDCMNTPGAFHCKCKPGFSPSMECRPVSDLGLVSGGISDDAISVSGSEPTYNKEVSLSAFDRDVDIDEKFRSRTLLPLI